jgi:hypothetical protein
MVVETKGDAGFGRVLGVYSFIFANLAVTCGQTNVKVTPITITSFTHRPVTSLGKGSYRLESQNGKLRYGKVHRRTMTGTRKFYPLTVTGRLISTSTVKGKYQNKH